MLDPQHRALVALSLFAALADGRTSEGERARIQATLHELAGVEPDLDAIANDVFLGRTTPEREAAAITDPALRLQAWQSALCVCESDGATSPLERTFLESLRRRLELPEQASAEVALVDRMVERPLDDERVDLLGETHELPPPPDAARPATRSAAPDVDLDAMIGRYAMLTAALELLPQTLATAGIVPLQAKMVYSIGKAFGYTLDRGHIMEFIGVAGAGLASQAVERVARGIVKGLAKKLLGGMLGSLGGVATGTGMTYATTWALGQVARSYYASGRKLSVEQLQEAFRGAVKEGQTLYQRHAPQIAARAKNLDVRSVLGGA